MPGLEVDFCGINLLLLPQKAVFIEKEKSLLIADPHFGKSGHFRQSGIPVSGLVQLEDLERLSHLISETSAERLFILGDFFHAQPNHEWLLWCEWLKIHSGLQVLLVPGNHDKHILKLEFPAQMQCTSMQYNLDNISLSHDETEADFPLICGHIHPSVYVTGAGKQGLKMPCFYMKQRTLILPAFGSFTGTFKISATRGERVFIPVNNQVIEIKTT
ncbi:MAG: ligase-associated DNA damage response endonuclease PdeM [Bacteroidia bacterium]